MPKNEEISYSNIRRRVDGSYQINKSGMPCHIPNERSFLNEGMSAVEAATAYAEWAEQWESVHAYALVHPDEVIVEEPPAPPTLEELKELKRSEIVFARDAAIRDGTTWQGHPIWTDGDAQRLALSIIAAPSLSVAIGSSEPVSYPTWTCKDGFVIQLDEAYATDLCLTIQTYVTTMYNTAAGLLMQLSAAQSAEDLAAIVWPEGA